MTGPAHHPDGRSPGGPQLPSPPQPHLHRPHPPQPQPAQWQPAPPPASPGAPPPRRRPRGFGPSLAAMIVLGVGLLVLAFPWALFLMWHFVILMGAPYHVVSSTVGLWAGANLWTVPPFLVAAVVLAVVALLRRDRLDPRGRPLTACSICVLVIGAVVAGILLLEIPLVGVEVCSSTAPCS